MVQATFPITVKPGYKPQAEDTSIESDVFFFGLLRQRLPRQRLQMAKAMIQEARHLSLCSLRQRFPALSAQQFTQKLAVAWLQEDCPPHFCPLGNEMTWIQDSIGLATQLHQIFVALSIPYYITGGIAAIAYGEPRTTRDLDVVISIALDEIDRLVQNLETAGFYIPGVEDIKKGRMQTLGITHIESISRADLVLSGSDEFDCIKFERRQVIQLSETQFLYFASPEDLILNKLRWGKRSQSEKQWRDILGILKVQGANLDYIYLGEWAEKLNLLADLQRAFVEAGI